MSRSGLTAGALSSRARSTKSGKAKSVQGIEPPVIPARKLRRKAAEEAKSENGYEAREIGAGQIWDFWAFKMNRCIIESQTDQSTTFDQITDAILGRPTLSEEKERERRKLEKEREARIEMALRKQRKVLEKAKAAVFGPPKSQDQMIEELRQEEEAALQKEQLARLEEKFEGVLTLL